MGYTYHIVLDIDAMQGTRVWDDWYQTQHIRHFMRVKDVPRQARKAFKAQRKDARRKLWGSP